ncbi:hypothetical protein SEPCBS119000_003455 [Sporothrix epigloea]|uniref:Gag protein n=1 Tax=Sporothrix epigloea TaxID=1892477 RepID=A0ABP0DLQ0_9PEZI
MFDSETSDSDDSESDYTPPIAEGIPVLKGVDDFWDWWFPFRQGLIYDRRLEYLLPTHPGSLDDVRIEYCGPEPRRPNPDLSGNAARTGTRPRSAARSSAATELQKEAGKRDRRNLRFYLKLEERFEKGLTLVEARINASVSTQIMNQLGDLDVKESIAYLYTTFSPKKGQLWPKLTNEYVQMLDNFSIPRLEEWLDEWSSLLQRMIMEGNQEVQTGTWIKGLSDRLAMSGISGWAYTGEWMSKRALDPDYYPATIGKVHGVVNEVLERKACLQLRALQEHNLRMGDLAAEEERGGQQQGSGSRSSSKRPRSGSQGGGPRQRRALRASTCDACTRPGHVLEKCWSLFPALRPDSLGRMRPNQEKRAKLILKKVQADPILAARYEAEKKC